MFINMLLKVIPPWPENGFMSQNIFLFNWDLCQVVKLANENGLRVYFFNWNVGGNSTSPPKIFCYEHNLMSYTQLHELYRVILNVLRVKDLITSMKHKDFSTAAVPWSTCIFTSLCKCITNSFCQIWIISALDLLIEVAS